MNPGPEPHRHPPLCQGYCLNLSKSPPLLHGPVMAPSGLSTASWATATALEGVSPLPAPPCSATDLPTHNEPGSPCCSFLSLAHKTLCDKTQLVQSLEAPLRLHGMQVHHSAAHFWVSPFRQSSTWRELSHSLLSPSWHGAWSRNWSWLAIKQLSSAVHSLTVCFQKAPTGYGDSYVTIIHILCFLEMPQKCWPLIRECTGSRDRKVPWSAVLLRQGGDRQTA